jgi:hypothetical protein
LLALALAGELGFERRAAEEISLEFYLAAMGVDQAWAPEARGLRELTAELCPAAEGDPLHAMPAEAGEPPAELAVSGPPTLVVTALWTVGAVMAGLVVLAGCVLSAIVRGS